MIYLNNEIIQITKLDFINKLDYTLNNLSLSNLFNLTNFKVKIGVLSPSKTCNVPDVVDDYIKSGWNSDFIIVSSFPSFVEGKYGVEIYFIYDVLLNQVITECNRVLKLKAFI